MDFALTEEQLELQAMVREFVEKEIVPYTDEMDKNNACRPEIIKKAGDMGLLNLVVPEEYGGPGLDSVTIAMIYEELGKGCVGVATSIAANALASYPILIAGNDEQKKYQCWLLLPSLNRTLVPTRAVFRRKPSRKATIMSLTGARSLLLMAGLLTVSLSLPIRVKQAGSAA